MLFDSVINFLKTIFIGLIAISPLIVYKALDDSAPNFGVADNTNPQDYTINSNNSNNRKKEESDSTSSYSNGAIFANTSNLFQSSIPPPPPPGDDAPIDDGVWILVMIGVGYGCFRLKKNAVVI